MAKRITVEHLWQLDRPTQPTVSPDGAQACVSVASFDMEENRQRSSLWLLSAFGGAPRRLTTAGEKDGAPCWSPDGRWIAFVAKRPAAGPDPGDDEPQVYLIAPDGGEARRLTSIATGASGLRWFPDFGTPRFISWVWPEVSGLAALAKRYKAWKDDKVKAHVVEHSAYRWWDHWLSDGRVPRLFTIDVESGAVRDLFAGTRYELVRADPDANHYDISPDGREIAFTFDPAEDKRFDHETHIATLDLRARKFRNVTTRSPLSHETPRYSPDGRWIALVTQDLRKSPVAMHRLASIDRAKGTLGSRARAGTAACTRRSSGARIRRGRVSRRGQRAPASLPLDARQARAGNRRARRHRDGLRARPAMPCLRPQRHEHAAGGVLEGAGRARAPHRPFQRARARGRAAGRGA
jgi:dipeptidyl aminopeptidase/acylaminoacyl peptidase